MVSYCSVSLTNSHLSPLIFLLSMGVLIYWWNLSFNFFSSPSVSFALVSVIIFLLWTVRMVSGQVSLQLLGSLAAQGSAAAARPFPNSPILAPHCTQSALHNALREGDKGGCLWLSWCFGLSSPQIQLRWGLNADMLLACEANSRRSVGEYR